MASRRKNVRWLAFAGVLALGSAGMLGWAIPTMQSHDYWDALVLFVFLAGAVGAITAVVIAIAALVRLQRHPATSPKP
jgi:hypothetical protein